MICLEVAIASDRTYQKVQNLPSIEILSASFSDWSCCLGLQNTPTASLQRGKTTPTSVLIMTLNN